MHTEIRCKEIDRSLKGHARTPEFAFQQKIREEDLMIYELLRKDLGEKKAEVFFMNGWGIVLGAAHILEKKSQDLKISDTYCEVLKETINKAINEATKEKLFFNNLATNHKMPLLAYRPNPSEGSTWRRIEIPKVIEDLNRFFQEGSLKFELYKDCRLYLTIDTDKDYGIFDKLWETNFSELLMEKGLEGLERNSECPHLTLINSSSIQKIKNKCGNDEKFKLFFDSILETINAQLKEEKNPLEAFALSTKYCEDYPLFEEIVVVKIKSRVIERALQHVVQKASELGTTIKVTDKNSYHVTIAVRHRQHGPISNDLTVQSIIDETGEFSTSFNQFWTILKG